MADLNFYPGYFECTFLEDCHIRDKTFKVTIPGLFNIKNQFEPNEENTSNIDTSMIAGKNTTHTSKPYTSTNVIIAENHTDYPYQLQGDVFKDRYTEVDGITEPSEDPSPDGSADDVIPHTHDIKKSMSLFHFYFENLNNIKIPKDSIGYGFFINGSLDRNSFAVVRIKGAVPLNRTEGDKTFYQESDVKSKEE